MFPYTEIFGLPLYEIFLLTAVLVGLFVADRLSVARGFSIALQKTMNLSFMAAILLGFGGAILFQSSYNFLATGKFVWNGMTFYGGLIFGTISFIGCWFIVGKKLCKENEPVKKFGDMANIAACLIPLAHGIGRIGCLTAGCCHGAETDAWYGIEMLTANGWAKVVPVQLFEALFLFALSGFLFWLFFNKAKYSKIKDLPLLPVYILLYGFWRYFIEFLRGDERGETIVSFLTPSQLIAILMIVVGVGCLCFKFYKKNSKAEVDKKE